MTYFTSWDTNVFLCLLSLGLPEDLVREWIYLIRGIDKQFCLERERSFHVDRFSPVVKFRSKHWRMSIKWYCTGGLSVQVYDILLREYKRKLEDIEPEDRYEYFEWGYENHYYTWTPKDLEWVKGFHPGRFFLLDHRRKEIMEDIRDLEDIGAWQEERFIRKQNHIEDLLNGKSSYSC